MTVAGLPGILLVFLAFLRLFFSAIGLSECQILAWRIKETIGLSDIGSRPQSIGLSARMAQSPALVAQCVKGLLPR